MTAAGDFLDWQRNDRSATALANWQANFGSAPPLARPRTNRSRPHAFRSSRRGQSAKA